MGKYMGKYCGFMHEYQLTTSLQSQTKDDRISLFTEAPGYNGGMSRENCCYRQSCTFVIGIHQESDSMEA